MKEEKSEPVKGKGNKFSFTALFMIIGAIIGAICGVYIIATGSILNGIFVLIVAPFVYGFLAFVAGAIIDIIIMLIGKFIKAVSGEEKREKNEKIRQETEREAQRVAEAEQKRKEEERKKEAERIRENERRLKQGLPLIPDAHPFSSIWEAIAQCKRFLQLASDPDWPKKPLQELNEMASIINRVCTTIGSMRSGDTEPACEVMDAAYREVKRHSLELPEPWLELTQKLDMATPRREWFS